MKKSVKVLICIVGITFIGCRQKGSLSFSSEDGNSSSGGGASLSARPSPSQVRMLNSNEFRNTVRDLLGFEVRPELVFGNASSGFDNSADGQLDENLLNALLDVSQEAASHYFDTRLSRDFPCFEGFNFSVDCVSGMLDQFGLRAFRRPLNAEVKNELLSFFQNSMAETGDGRMAVESLITRMLVSPHFLYRTEVGKLKEGTNTNELDAFEKASFISYALTASMPDEILMRDALNNSLTNSRIRYHVKRLIGTERGRTQVVRFFKQWLRMGELDQMVRNVAGFPKLTGVEQARALRDEFDRYVTGTVLDGEGTLMAFLTENFTYVNRHTAPLYGLSVDTDEMVKVNLPRERRSGVFTLASVMSVFSSSVDSMRDRPVLRGTLISSRVLCQDIGIPSGLDLNAARNEAVTRNPDFDNLTVREQFEVMMEQSQVCSTCHQQFMPYGYVLGNYNGLGEYVTVQRGRPINASITNVSVNGRGKSYDNAVSFIEDLSKDERVYRCFTRQMVKYVIGNGGGRHVDDLSRVHYENFKKGYFDINHLIESVLSSEAVYKRESARL